MSFQRIVFPQAATMTADRSVRFCLNLVGYNKAMTVIFLFKGNFTQKVKESMASVLAFHANKEWEGIGATKENVMGRIVSCSVDGETKVFRNMLGNIDVSGEDWGMGNFPDTEVMIFVDDNYNI